MKVGEFHKEIGANSASYSRFMSQNGAYKGSGSSVYVNAWQFLKKREMRGIKAPRKKAKTDEETAATPAAAGDATAGAAAPASAKKAADAVPDVDSVILDGETEDQVEVYDSCDDICGKISAHLLEPGVTQASFLRSIASCFHAQPDKKIQSKVLNDFRNKKGATAGNMSSVYYGAYVYFEKLRIAEKKPKSKKRDEMEAVWGKEGGMDREHRMDRVLAPIGASISQDKLGRVHVSGW